MRVLVLNSGSSSVKYQLVDSDTGERLTGGIVEEVDDHESALGQVVGEVERLDRPVEAIGHRVVHGGDVFSEPARIDDQVVEVIRELVPLAPLHNPANLAGIEAARETWPDVPQVAVFDTAFHRTLPPAAHRYAVPDDWYEQHGVRRYGFHGTSHDYVSARAADVLGRPRDELDLIVAHLGNGASITAVHHGCSVETSMGLSPLEGLVMGTRSGDVDPAIIGHVAGASGRSEADVLGDLNRVSGLLGLCGDSDMREITARVDAGDEAAELALDVFCHRIKKYVGAYVAVLGGCDALVFTAGIGEHSAEVRSRVCAGLGVLGISLDDDRNRRAETMISRDGASTAVLVVPTDEEHAIAEQTARLLAPRDR
ncbi:MAG TPA: acetate kinase [Ilumatobacteraceae bacterium]|nr:acetate kinase [Ilumatobacteraceae bacterium]